MLGIFCLVVVLEILRGVLLRRKGGIQGNLHFLQLRIIVVFGNELGLTAFHPIEIGGNQFTADSEQIPVSGAGKLFSLVFQLPGGTIPKVGDGFQRCLGLGLHPGGSVLLGIKAVQQGRKALLLLGLHQRSVLEDGQIGKVPGRSVFQQQIRRFSALQQLLKFCL